MEIEEFKKIFGEIEGEDHLDYSCNKDNGYSIKSVMKSLEEMRSDDKFPIGTIYGRGGWNRYFVYSNGEIVFSAYHANEKDIEKAKSLGIKVL
jgi:hypothetical protein